MDSVSYSIRYNPNKSIFRIGENVPWEKSAIFIEQKEFILDPDWHAGAYYVQESNSMFLGYILEQIQVQKNVQIVLDACAAPGGKSTHILDKISKDSLLIANEILPKRNSILRENLIRWGNPNIIVTQNDTKDFKSLYNYFDLVVLDAPCSGEGLLRKKPELAVEFTPENIEKCAIRQKEIIDNLKNTIKQNGYLIYSTCTFQTCENEDQVQYLLDNGFEIVPIDIAQFPEITIGKIPHTYYFTFEKTKGSGFFIACLKKISTTQNIPSNYYDFSRKNQIFDIQFKEAEKWIKNSSTFKYFTFKNNIFGFPKTFVSTLNIIQTHLYITYFGIEIGELKKDIFIPAHNLALSNYIHPDLSTIEINKPTALQFLRKQNIQKETINTLNISGWALFSYNKHHLGWVKILQDRINNYLPNNWRILKS